MKTANRVLLALTSFTLLVFAVGFMLPSHWHAEATISIGRTPEKIYPLVASFKNGWAHWSPFGLASDKGLRMAYAGPAEGIGAAQRWTASKKGDGQMTITYAEPQSGIKYDLTMVNGFNVAGEMRFVPEGDSTVVTWTDDGEFKGPLGRYVALFMPSMLSKSLGRGLENLKSLAETR